MTAAITTQIAAPSDRTTLLRIVAGGLAGGAVDFVYATGMALASGAPATRPWRSVASGWIGREAGQGGAGVLALGVATHFGIATGMAAAYVLIARRIPVVVARPWLTAGAYGLVLYAVMYVGVLPLRWPGAFPRWDGLRSLLDILAHIGVALAIAGAATAINPKPASVDRV